MPFEVTLRPEESGAAATALYVYAAMIRDAELKARLDAVDWEAKPRDFDSIPTREEDPFDFLRILAEPFGTVETLKETMLGDGLEPVALVVRFVEKSDEKKTFVKLEFGTGDSNLPVPGAVIFHEDVYKPVTGKDGDEA